MRFRIALIILLAGAMACQTLLPKATAPPRPDLTLVPLHAATATAPKPTRTPRGVVTPEPQITEHPSAPPATLSAGGARLCDYVPGVSIPAEMPPEAPWPTPLPFVTTTPLPTTAVDSGLTQAQLEVLQELREIVDTEYVYPDFNGRDWDGLADYYQQMIEAGLATDAFYLAMSKLVYALGDEHSYYENPEQVQAAEQQFAGNNDYIGIGVLVEAVPEANRGAIVLTFPGGAAAEAGLRAHDGILAVNGAPLLDEQGLIRNIIRGEEGTQVTLTIQRPGEEPHDVTLTRRRVTGALPLDYCLIGHTRIAYIFLPGLDDETIPSQMREALEAMTVDGPLAGVILDNRQNGGGADSVTEEVLGFFTKGVLGHFVSRFNERAFKILGKDIRGSQNTPLVVLVDSGTVSFGEIMSGALQNSGRAVVMGETTLGNVELMYGYDFSDNSRAWIAHDTFRPINRENAEWERTGIIPDVTVPSRWDLFTEATDPVLAHAVDWLLEHGK
jgi:C-terminal peptidase prc